MSSTISTPWVRWDQSALDAMYSLCTCSRWGNTSSHRSHRTVLYDDATLNTNGHALQMSATAWQNASYSSSASIDSRTFCALSRCIDSSRVERLRLIMEDNRSASLACS